MVEPSEHSPARPVPTVTIAGWPHVRLTGAGFARRMADDCLLARQSASGELPRLAFSMNGEALSLAARPGPFRQAMKLCDYIQADGQSLVFASALLSGASLPERISTTDFIHDAARVAVREGLRFYFLGADETTNQRAVERLQGLYPQLQIVGRRNGYFSRTDEALICAEIVAARTDVLWIGLGKPAEQLFCLRNHEALRGVGWIKTCGGLLNFLSGDYVRAPLWMQNAGLEWLHRLSRNPRRLFWRYLITNPHALYCMLRFRSRSFTE